jgi:hypothetical protein
VQSGPPGWCATDPATAGFFMPGKLPFSWRKPPGKVQDSCGFPRSFLQLSSQKHTSFLVENIQVSCDFPTRNRQESCTFLAGFLGLSWGFLAGFQGLSWGFTSRIGYLFQGFNGRGCPLRGRAVVLRIEPLRVSPLRASIPHPTPKARPAGAQDFPAARRRAEGYAAARRPRGSRGGIRLFAPFLARTLRVLARPARQPPAGDVGAASLGSHSVTCPCNSKCPYGAPAQKARLPNPPPCRPGRMLERQGIRARWPGLIKKIRGAVNR